MKDARGDSFREIMTSVLRKVGSFVAPTTPRGRVRRATVFIAVLLVFSGLLSYPNVWNNTADRINSWSDNTPGFSWVKAPRAWDIPFRLGLDLQGGTHLVYVADMSSIPDSDHDDSIAGVRDVIERRVNAFGVSEPLVQTNKAGEEWRLIVDLAGVSDISEAIKLIGETPILEFKEPSNEPPRELTEEERTQLEEYNTAAENRAEEALKKASAADADFSALVGEYSEDSLTKANDGRIESVTADGPYAALHAAILDGGEIPEGSVLPALVDTPVAHHIVKYEGTTDGDREVEASHILVCWKGTMRCESERSKEEAEARVNELLGQLNSENFAEMAKENSDDLGSGPLGGELGYFSEGMMVTSFEDAVFAMADDEIKGPVESEFGYHIIHKTGDRQQPVYTLSHIQIDKQQETDYVPNEEWKNTELSGKHLKRSLVTFDPQTNEPQVTLEFNEEGKEMFGEITERNVGAPVAIYLDGEPISVPTVNEPILGGGAVISGSFNIAEAKLLARRLNAGALPVPIHLETQQSVGATLGNESMNKSLQAGLIGFLIVALFMLLYYRLPGLVAIIALAIYTSVNLALYKLIPVTLSLSGIAGFILSVGMAVDANILIFERLKEELLRGRTLQSAIDEGFRRAWLSIRDSNLTTLISCTILFYTSSSLIKGFALTLGLGVLISMFSAITVSRTLLRLMAGWEWLKSEKLYLPGLTSKKKVEDEESAE